MEWLMSAIFAANTMLAARQSNGPKSMPEIPRKWAGSGALLPMRFPEANPSRAIFFPDVHRRARVRASVCFDFVGSTHRHQQ
jgi:hypothetical protein